MRSLLLHRRDWHNGKLENGVLGMSDTYREVVERKTKIWSDAGGRVAKV